MFLKLCSVCLRRKDVRAMCAQCAVLPRNLMSSPIHPASSFCDSLRPPLCTLKCAVAENGLRVQSYDSVGNQYAVRSGGACFKS